MDQPDKLPEQSWKAVVELAQPKEVEGYLIDEIFKALGARADSLLRAWLGPFFTPLVAGFARQAADFDANVARLGFQKSAQDWLQKWIPGLQLVGEQHLPSQGSLLIAANHPGTFDGLSIAAAVPRQDLKIIAAANPFFRALPNTRDYFVYATRDAYVRMATLRSALRHLQSGGALLIFPSGRLDPDPLHFKAAARQALEHWSASLNFLLKKAPLARLTLAINSGFVAAEYLQNPFVRIRSSDEGRQKLAETLQVIHQVVFNHRISSRPSVIFSEPIPAAQFMSNPEDIQAQILAIASCLMDTTPLGGVG